MGPTSEKLNLTTTQSDLQVLEERGFILEKIIGEGSYAKVKYTLSPHIVILF